MKFLYAIPCFLALTGCGMMNSVSTSRVQEFSSVETMNSVGTCKKLGDINHEYSVFMLLPGDREAAGHAQLKSATEAMGGNAAVMLTRSMVFGDIKDTVRGMAYKCEFNE
jgi:hypothetical protein